MVAEVGRERGQVHEDDEEAVQTLASTLIRCPSLSGGRKHDR